MKRTLLVVMIVLAGAVTLATTVRAGQKEVTDARFTVQSHDIAVEVLTPKLDNSSTSGRTVITGCHVAVLLSDLYEMTSAPQCHWDGINERSRYSYTLYYHQKGVKDGSVTSYSLNLRDFISVAADSQGVHIASMGVVPEDGIVRFRTATFETITHGSDPREFFASK